MNKRNTSKKLRKDTLSHLIKVDISKELKEDSIAHKIKSYFELETVQNRLLFRYDKESGKLLISRKHIMYLLSLCNDIETLKNYDMQIVDYIDLFK